MPHLEKLRSEYAGAVEFLGINEEEPQVISEFVTKRKLTIPVLLDSDGDIHRTYGALMIPTLFILDREGILREHFVGGLSEKTLRAALERLHGAN